jgi:uncharacterized protein (DUF4415 family)
MQDADIDYSDLPPLDKSFLKKATVPWPPVKKQLTIRIDADVVEWLKSDGRGYQTRINRILRVVMESQPPSRRGVKPLPAAGQNLLSSAPSTARTSPPDRSASHPDRGPALADCPREKCGRY